MKKKATSRKITKTSKPARVKMGVPTVAERLATIERSINTTAAALGIDTDEITSRDPDVRAVALPVREVKNVAAILCSAYDAVSLLQELPPDVLNMLAPSFDQRNSFEKIEVSR